MDIHNSIENFLCIIPKACEFTKAETDSVLNIIFQITGSTVSKRLQKEGKKNGINRGKKETSKEGSRDTSKEGSREGREQGRKQEHKEGRKQ